MSEISITGSSCLRLHLLLELMNQGGGSVSSRLVSEEDIELKFACPITAENLRSAETLVLRDSSSRRALRLSAGDILDYTWKLHVDVDKPLAPEHAVRFEMKGRA